MVRVRIDAGEPQLCLAIGGPILFNVLFGVLLAYINSKFEGTQAQFKAIDQGFDAVHRRFDLVNQRFDDMRGPWRAELYRFAEVLDAGLNIWKNVVND